MMPDKEKRATVFGKISCWGKTVNNVFSETVNGSKVFAYYNEHNAVTLFIVKEQKQTITVTNQPGLNVQH